MDKGVCCLIILNELFAANAEGGVGGRDEGRDCEPTAREVGMAGKVLGWGRVNPGVGWIDSWVVKGDMTSS